MSKLSDRSHVSSVKLVLKNRVKASRNPMFPQAASESSIDTSKMITTQSYMKKAMYDAKVEASIIEDNY